MATAEAATATLPPAHYGSEAMPDWLLAEPAARLESAETARQEYAAFIGAVAVECALTDTSKPEAAAKPRESLLAVLQAPELSEDDMALITTNARTKVAEILSKSGSILEAEATINLDGEIEQFGQTTKQRQRMTLVHYPDQSETLRANTHAEGQNAFLLEAGHRSGELRGKQVLEWSLVLDTASRQELVDYGFFLDSMTAIGRLTAISAEGEVTITSGLVGGVDQDELPEYRSDETAEDEAARYDLALEKRFDVAVIRELYTQWGVEAAQDMNTTELLASPLVLPDTLDIIDFLMLYDQIAAARLRKPVFFGLTGLAREYGGEERAFTRADYEMHRTLIKLRQESFESVTQAVTAELLQRRNEPQTPIDAVDLLDEIADRHTLRHAVYKDKTIDARMIFGRQAAQLVDEARQAAEWGQNDVVEQKLQAAEAVVDTKGCPTGRRNKKEESGAHQSDSENSKDDKDKKKGRSKREWMRCVTCPLCQRKPVDATIDYYPVERVKRITCCKCNGHKDYEY